MNTRYVVKVLAMIFKSFQVLSLVKVLDKNSY